MSQLLPQLEPQFLTIPCPHTTETWEVRLQPGPKVNQDSKITLFHLWKPLSTKPGGVHDQRR